MKKGFTLIETIIAVGIGLALLGFVLANYRRGGDDSTLSKEINLLMGRIRLAQEETASGKTMRYCDKTTSVTGPAYYFSGTQCTSDADCDDPTTAGNDNMPCSAPTVPPGGYGLTFSCGNAGAAYDQVTYPNLSPLAKTHYYEFADIAHFSGNHYPADHTNPMVSPEADRQVTYHMKHNKYRGDTLMVDYQIGAGVVVQDLFLREEGGVEKFSCLASNANYRRSPWNNASIPIPPSASDDALSSFPLQASVFFDTPDGRETILSDNIYTSTPPTGATLGVNTLGQPWAEIGIMLKLTKRNEDCRYVTVSKNGTLSEGVDVDCKF